MKLTKLSKYRFYRSAKDWEVDMEYAQAMYNYFVHGFQPGGFFTALLANDAFGALSRSHPANTAQSLKNLVGWINNMPLRDVAYGSYAAVDRWLTATPSFRREILEKAHLIFTEEDEIMLVLKGENIDPPYIELTLEYK
jgi:hypothetical protein